VVVLLLLGAGVVLAEDHLRERPEAYAEATTELEGLDGMALQHEVHETDDGDIVWPACMANEFSVPGQGVHVSGSVGGLVRQPNGSTGALRPEFVEPDTRTLLDHLRDNATHDVAILVVDDFGPSHDVFQVSDDVEEAPNDRHELDLLVQGGMLSHGALVLQHLVALATDVLDHDPNVSEEGARYEWDLNGARLIVDAVPVRSEEGEAIAGAIENAIVEADYDPHVDRIVVNMSWVLLPCDVVNDFDPNQFEHFEAYLKALEVHHDGRYTLEMLQRLVTWVDERGAMGMHVSDQAWADGALEHVAYVAAAGNFGLPFQMFPAAWPTVTGASADDAFSNKNGVIELGGLFRLEGRDVYYLGTSFTAPAVSLAAALDMAGEDPECAPWSPGATSPFAGAPNEKLHDAWCWGR
jgi:hypothetical protein